MRFIVELDPKIRPNEFGEMLRDKFFDQTKGTGCYSTFETLPDVKQLASEEIENDFYTDLGIKYQVFSKEFGKKTIIMKYYWDGDGTLEFHFEDGSYLINDDCKKDYTWEYYSA